MPRGINKSPVHYRPLVTDEEILDFVHSMNGNRQHDKQLCFDRGFPLFTADVLRRVFGKAAKRGRILTREERERIVNEYRDGVAIKKIAKGLGVTETTVFDTLKSEGVETNRNPGWSEIARKRLVYLREVKKMTFAQLGEYFGKEMSTVFQEYRVIKRHEAKEHQDAERAEETGT